MERSAFFWIIWYGGMALWVLAVAFAVFVIVDKTRHQRWIKKLGNKPAPGPTTMTEH